MKKSNARLFSLMMSLVLIITSMVVPMPISAEEPTTPSVYQQLADMNYVPDLQSALTIDFEDDADLNYDATSSVGGTCPSDQKGLSDGRFYVTSTAKDQTVFLKLDGGKVNQLIEFDISTMTNTDNKKYYFLITSGKVINSNATVNASTIVAADGTAKHISILWDYTNKKYSLWENEELITSDADFHRSLSTESLYLELYAPNGNTGTMYVDNIKRTPVSTTDEKFTEWGLTSDVINNGVASSDASGHLYLPNKTPIGDYSIIWEADEYINVDSSAQLGRLNGSRIQQSTIVLTAKVVYNGFAYKKDFTYVLPINTLPEVSGELFENLTFDYADTTDITSVLDSKYTSNDGLNAADMQIKDKKLVIKGESEAHHVLTVDITDTVKDRLVYEFDFSRNSTTAFYFMTPPSNTNTNKWASITATFGSSITMSETAGSEDGGSATENSIKASHTKTSLPTHVVISLDKMVEGEITPGTNSKNAYKVSMWIDGIKVADRLNPRNPISVDTICNIERLNFRTKANLELSIDNIKIYQAKAPVDPDVSSLVASIGDGSTSIVATSDNGAALSLDLADSKGCDISYSDTLGLISADGTITMPAYDTQTDVTLTISKNGHTDKVTVPVKVAGKLYLGDITHVSDSINIGDNISTLTAYTRAEGEEYSSVFAAVAYYKGSEMIAIDAKTITLPDMNGDGMTSTFTCNIKDNTLVTRKDFVFDSASNMKPLKKNNDSLTLPVYFTDNMVLQRGEDIDIWGKTSPEVNVAVSFNGESASGTSDREGNFKLTLPAMEAYSGGELEVVTPNSSKTLKNVAVGDVWLVSGQSNAEYSMDKMISTHADNTHQAELVQDMRDDIASAKNSNIRYMKMGYENINATVCGEPKDEYYKAPNTGEWFSLNSSTAGDFGAIAFYFADYIQPELNIPIGIINAAKAGKWLHEFVNPALGYRTDRESSGLIYNEQILPLLKLNIKGMLWAQGENNYQTTDYDVALKEYMIDELRGANGFNNPNMPFIYGQLQRYQNGAKSYKYIRELMRKLENPEDNIFMSVSIDLNTDDKSLLADSEMNHPLGKDKVGERMARQALHYVYGKTDVVPCGPKYVSNTVSGSVMTLYFEEKSIGSFLKAEGGKLLGFKLAGEDKLFYDAEASIDAAANTVKVESANVEAPKYVRYIYEAYPEKVTLFNNEGMPASPFATDTPAWDSNEG